MRPFRVTIYGGGGIGTALAAALSAGEGFEVQLVDVNDEALDLAKRMHLPIKLRGAMHPDDAGKLAMDQDLVVAAVPDRNVHQIAAIAAQAKTHYLDFSHPDQASSAALGSLSAERVVVTGCGASPGLVENFAADLLRNFSSVQDVTIRAGAIPRFPTNRLGYGKVWNFDGLFDEYMQPSTGLRKGQPVQLTPLEEYEQFTIDGVPYEAFITSGGVSDVRTIHNNLSNLTFKTIRHPGHLDYIRFLLEDLGLRDRRDMLRSVLSNGLPVIEDDVVLFFITARGFNNRQLVERSVFHRLAPKFQSDRFNALTRVAVGYAASVVSMLKDGKINVPGIVDHRDIDTTAIKESSFLQ